MGPINGFTTTPHHRQNRRRERPGSRSRRTITRKASLQHECHEGYLDAHDISVQLPSDRTRPSPLLRQNFDNAWLKWKAREAQEKAVADISKIKAMEDEQLRLFGGNGGDDELRSMGILYIDEDDDVLQDEDANPVSCDVPVEQSFPMFVLRQGKPRRSRRQATWRSLPPLYLSFSNLSDDFDVKRWLSPSHTPISTIQHRDSIITPSSRVEEGFLPQSLPSPPAFESMYHFSSLGSSSSSDEDDDIPTSPSHSTISLLPKDQDQDQQGWTLIDRDDPPHPQTQNNTTTIQTPTTPCSEPETWELIDDS